MGHLPTGLDCDSRSFFRYLGPGGLGDVLNECTWVTAKPADFLSNFLSLRLSVLIHVDKYFYNNNIDVKMSSNMTRNPLVGGQITLVESSDIGFEPQTTA